MSSTVVSIKKHRHFPKRVAVTTSKNRMRNGHSSPQEQPKEENGNTDHKPASILSTGGRQLKKNVSFSDWNSIYLIPKQLGDKTQQCGYVLDAKHTHMNLLDARSLSEVDEDSEVELTTVLGDQGLDQVKPNDSPFSPETQSDVMVCCSSPVTAFGGQQEMLLVGSLQMPTPPTEERATKPVRMVSFRSSKDDPYEEARLSWLKRKSVDDAIKEKRREQWFKAVGLRASRTVKDSVHSLNKEEVAENIGSRTCEAIKDYIVGLSDQRSSNRFGSDDLVPVYVAVKGTLSKKVIRKESTTKNKRGLDLVGTHTLRNENINCAIRFYYDKDAREIAESRLFRQ